MSWQLEHWMTVDNLSPDAMPKPENKTLVAAALRLLARRDYSRTAFINKLVSAEFEKAEVESAADWCHEQGFLNEARFAESASRRLGTKYGAQRVAYTLRQKGVTEDEINAAVSTLKASELARATAIWVRKFCRVPASGDEKSRQIRYLQSRGFNFAIVKQIMAGTVDDS